jgi:hypothetical protein
MEMKVKVEWTVELTESYEVEMDFEDFQTLFGEGAAPTLDEFKAGQFDKGDMDQHALADSETEGMFVSVDERYIDSVEAVES